MPVGVWSLECHEAYGLFGVTTLIIVFFGATRFMAFSVLQGLWCFRCHEDLGIFCATGLVVAKHYEWQAVRYVSTKGSFVLRFDSICGFNLLRHVLHCRLSKIRGNLHGTIVKIQNDQRIAFSDKMLNVTKDCLCIRSCREMNNFF